MRNSLFSLIFAAASAVAGLALGAAARAAEIDKIVTPDAPVAAAPQAPAAPPSLFDRAVDKAGELVLGAMAQLGIRYRRGGTTPDGGFDCSGFVRHVYQNTVGLLLPRTSAEMAREGEKIDKSELQPGDLVFFNTLRRAYSHVGIYIGEGKFVHAPSSGGVVRVESMELPYWQKRFNGARRVDALYAAPPAASASAAALKSPAALRAGERDALGAFLQDLKTP
jgi:cell wall-associated NlpC family hydrolase